MAYDVVLRAKMDLKLQQRQLKKDEQFAPALNIVSVIDVTPRTYGNDCSCVAEGYEPNDYELAVLGKLPTIDEI